MLSLKMECGRETIPRFAQVSSTETTRTRFPRFHDTPSAGVAGGLSPHQRLKLPDRIIWIRWSFLESAEHHRLGSPEERHLGSPVLVGRDH